MGSHIARILQMCIRDSLMGAPGDSWDGSAPAKADPVGGDASVRVPEEHRDEVAVRLEGPGTTPTPQPSDEVTPAPQAQTHPESEAR